MTPPDPITKPIFIVGFSEKGTIISAMKPENLAGGDRGSDFFAYAMSCLARNYVDMMLTHGQFSKDGSKPREVDREYMKAELVREFTQHMAEGRTGTLIT